MQTDTYMALTRYADKRSARNADAATVNRIRAYVAAAFGSNGTAAFDASMADTRPVDAFVPGSVQRARAIVTSWGHGHAV